MRERSTAEPRLSVHRSFVVQFRREMGADGRRLLGRVEHVTSGRATHFTSAKGLTAFLQEVLREVETRSDGSAGENPIRRRSAFGRKQKAR